MSARNVRLTVTIDVALAGAVAEGASVDDDTFYRASALVHEVWEAGDPGDETNAVIIVTGVDPIRDA